MISDNIFHDSSHDNLKSSFITCCIQWSFAFELWNYCSVLWNFDLEHHIISYYIMLVILYIPTSQSGCKVGALFNVIHLVHSTLERWHVPSYSQNTLKNRENPAWSRFALNLLTIALAKPCYTRANLHPPIKPLTSIRHSQRDECWDICRTRAKTGLCSQAP